MATPEPSDPSAPTQKVEPAAATTRLEPESGRTRWITAVLRPGGRTPEARDADSEHTVTLGARTRRLGTPRGEAARAAGAADPAPWWRWLLGPLLDWFARLVGRLVTSPASGPDYAVPAELRRRYTILDHIGSGGEAVVYLAEPAGRSAGDGSAPGRRLALKVYRPGHDINRELLERLRARGTAASHTPAIHGYGHARSSWGEEVAWEAQEYFSAGSLRGLIDQAPLPDERAREIVAGVAECLHHWQDELQHNHTDVKPENLLIRQTDPPVFALTDFGGAVRATMSRVYGGLAITEDYAAPEVIEGRREAPAAWWSLGIMVHEMLTGRRPQRGENWLTARNTEVDVSAIADERWRLLARGLLTPAPDARWGHAQVVQWLDGRTPGLERARRHAPIRFADVTHEDPPSLAYDLLDRSDKGEVWLGAHWPTLRTWLDREVRDFTFDRGYLTRLADHPEQAHLTISALAARFVPGMPPRYRGHEVSAEGVRALAAGDASRHPTLREAIELGALGLAARHWCGHPACRSEGTNRCALLERVQHEVPLVMEQVELTVNSVGRSGVRDFSRPARHEWDAAWALAAELVLDPDADQRHRRRLRAQSWHPAQRSDAPRVDWWRDLRRSGLRGRPGQVATSAALVASLLLLPCAARAGAKVRERDRQDARARWRHRWDQVTAAAGGGWANLRERVGAARATTEADPASRYGPQWARRRDGRPLADWERDVLDPKSPAETRRADRAMRRLKRAMRAGRCRGYAYPAGVLGLLDGIGQWLWTTRGLYSALPAMESARLGLTEFSQNPAMAGLARVSGNLLQLLPGQMAQAPWFAIVLGLALLALGRTAANRRRSSRVQLAARHLALAGTVLMALRLLASGLLLLGMGVLIPLSLVTG
ncbi:protein kinase domain-containing protein [Marinitenerispora sediminis]|uniref:Serine/threonine protein kinase n=1 Tax=Marinitenerispora sediminis TaxID=1931232 RepID=A0A368T846_9ACTN|nr:protein kinase [Marinitenerispora sediminis]RCV56688.1 serine/threonine protein kinase [Marinitenerispora sediminis]RCV58453.1 serine/threonine protein kinase [Marinitenerispora sediminis]RCV61680.1 serine/threonine protein kinase [Marinitenerispora sediminis]